MNQDDLIVLSTGKISLKDSDPNSFYFYSVSSEQSLESDFSLSSYLKVVWSEGFNKRCSYQCFYKGVKQKLEVKASSSFALFDLTFLDEGLKLLAYVNCPEKQPVSFMDIQGYKNLLILPLVGLINRQWRDGFCGHVIQGGLVSSMVPAGPFQSLSFPYKNLNFQPDPQDSWKIKDLMQHFSGPEYLRLSLVAAISSQLGATARQAIDVDLVTFSLETAVSLLLLRQAYPEAKIQLISKDIFKNWPKPWKHFANCLGMQAAPEQPGHLALPASEIAKHINPSRLQELAIHMNGPSQILRGLLRVDTKH
ncbi:MAG: hypothetical protein AB8G05_02830 [Oligoflexales bacterium]